MDQVNQGLVISFLFACINLNCWLLNQFNDYKCVQVFGLGNKTYEHYNAVAIYVDKRLEELGGSRVYELGLGDDDAKWVFTVLWYRFY